MLGVLGAEMVEQPGRALHHRTRARVIGVEGAQRVVLDARADILGELLLVGTQVGLQALAVLAAALGASEARESQAHLSDLELGEQRGQQHDRLGVHGRVLRAQRLGPHLPELAVAPRLGALVAEEARQVPELHRLAALVHPVLHIGATDRGGALRAQRERAPGGVLEREHLLTHDVRRGAHPTREQLGGLHGGGLDALVSGALEDRACARLEGRAGRGVLAEHVEGASRRFDLGVAQRGWAGASAVASCGRRARSSERNGLVSYSRPSVVTPMWPG